MNATNGNISQDLSVFNSQQPTVKPDPRSVRTDSSNTESRPDWILYTVPATAFVIGVFLFSYVCKTQQRRNEVTKQRKNTNGHIATNTLGSNSQRYITRAVDNKKDETQSYENVEAAIYNNQDKVTYYVSADEDYLNPDAMGEEEVMVQGGNLNTLQLPSNLTDTDGESYENMEGCLYAQPRKQTKRIQNTTDDEDYINPDDNGKQDLTQDHTDTESYEMMAGSDCVYNNTDFPSAHDDDSYELMNGIVDSIHAYGGREGE